MAGPPRSSASHLAIAGLLLGMTEVGCRPPILSLGQRRVPEIVGAPRHIVTQLAAGERHTCALVDDGEVWCWGSNAFGQLGQSSGAALSWTPTRVVGVEGAAQIAAASGLTCARLRDGTARCWGHAKKTLAFSPSTPLEGIADAAEIAVGFDLLCVRRADGSVACRRPVAGDAFRTVAGVADAEQLVVGFGHACALVQGGSVRCWGANAAGELGDGTTEPRVESVLVRGLEHVVQLHASRARTCAWQSDGAVSCWGDLVVQRSATEPIEISEARGIGGFAATTDRACSWSGEGRVDCVQSGHGLPRRSSLSGVQGVVQIVAGGAHFCSLGRDGDVHCWGHDDDGQLGDPGTASATPREIPGVIDAATVAVATSYACAVRRSGRVVCWGTLGLGDTEPRTFSAFDLPEIKGAEAIALADESACVLRAGGRVRCLAIAPTKSSDELVDIDLEGLVGVKQVGVGRGFACALLANESVWCWGRNSSGQLGDDKKVAHRAPIRVPELGRVAELAVDATDACARLVDGSLRCWGTPEPSARASLEASREARFLERIASPSDDAYPRSFGLQAFQGDRRAVNPRPSPVQGERKWRGLARGEGRSCALADAEAWCWTDASDTALAFDAQGASALAVTADHACALIDDGTVRCWGQNDFGQLGQGSISERVETPRPVLGLDHAVQVAARANTTCALLASGAVRCWGQGDRGQLGDGIGHGDRSVPLRVPRWLAK